MEILEMLEILNRGEDSKHQFKKNITNADALAAEMIAFSNTKGGRIFIGVDDDGSIAGLTSDDLRRLDNLISNTASQNVKPAINPFTEIVSTDTGFVLVVDIPQGLSKPYQDLKGVFWVKSGADKRKSTSREELQRLFLSSSLILADEIPVTSSTVSDIDLDYFKNFYLKRYGKSLDDEKLPLPKILENMRLLKENSLTIGAALLFAKSPQFILPIFIVKAIAIDDITVDTENYSDSRNIEGKLADMYQHTVSFIVANLHHKQGNQSFNSVGTPEIPHITIGELVANALMHRDYFTSAPIRVFIFKDRVEIISPGHLPNNLTIENIKTGASNARNPILASHASHILPYRGIGTGIVNALSHYPYINFIDDRDTNMFKAILKRKPAL